MAMETQDNMIAGQHPAPMKFSRYRSVRKAAAKQPPEANPLPPVSIPPVASASPPRDTTHASASGTIQRSMSRYRRRAPAAQEVDSQPPVPAHPPGYKAPVDNGIDPVHPHFQDSEGAEMVRMRNKLAVRLASRERRPQGTNEDDEAQREKHRQNAMERLTGGEIKASVPASHPRSATRERSADKAEDPSNRRPRKDSEYQGRTNGTAFASRRASNEPRRQSLSDAPLVSAIDTNVSAQFPGFDAPVSAVNARERRVVVQYRKTSLKICVTPSTSARDIVSAALAQMAAGVDPEKFILMESFAELGLERPLRRYEYVRDVMNSWTHDEQNTLIVVPAASLDALTLLDGQNVSLGPPADVTFHMYYSQRPRKWDKRYVTLRSDGQVTVSKKENAQDSTNTCHVSDFDIYSPTASYLANNVKPPKKFCQAVKSQQKSNMFVSTENFVHFFSTNDRDIADGWYRAVQTWRSWYLVTRLGAGQPEAEAGHADEVTGKSPPKPLLNPFEEPANEVQPLPALERTKSTKTKELFSHKKSTRERGPPPTSFPKLLTGESDLAAGSSSDEAPFSASGLLGRTYTMRQRAMKEREEQEKLENEELLRQGLIGAMGSRRPSRTNTMTSTHGPDPNLIRRTQSMRTKPLVDLTPVYQEPPQHIRKGRGVAVEPGLPLIDAATSVDAPGGIQIPSATTWRRPQVAPESAAPEVRTRNRSNTARSINNQPRYHHTAPTTPTDVENIRSQDGPFIPNSLLARSVPVAAAQGPPVGHGVATGDRNASKPMLDMSPENPFAEGSLLRGL
ncbi:hypothetical protein BO78DRAFT_127040 [Aspergillus sclerotiicarbonarius CBS 121057]|uniref:Ras-associating domain-containing protein n=1 Tax=Aspergillus sclerotiicarbonarius (strain CBS 121057 / IBT 28362) TaxID=1448318 RepID=A0A319E762_ASPSB|nr:hypothetical protein BO78DRAFT_127040 [Aspergillus sclerotiicarbonarius CBS 121057]